MSRNYGSLGGRRSGGGAWQWVVIGVIMGFACSIIIGLAGIATGLLYLDVEGLPGRATATAIVQVITATPLPATETPTPGPVEPTSTPTTMEVAQVSAPTATPTTQVIQVEASPSPSPTTGAAPQNLSAAGGQDNSTIPERLAALMTELVSVTGGTFEMGTTLQEVRTAVDACLADAGECQVSYGEDSFPPHQVTLDPFQIEVFEVTYEQYLAFLNSELMGPRSHLNGCDGFACLATQNETDASNVTFDSASYRVPPVLNNHPIAGVTWYGARAYCRALGRRLPTEAEWERAARGSQASLFPWGNDLDTARAKTSRPVVEENLRGAVPVDSYPNGVSEYGVFNMAGNVEEWVNDWYSSAYYNQQEASGLNPQGPPTGTEKVLRGGSWAYMPFFARTVHRRSLAVDQQSITAGFRCAAEAADAAANIGSAGVNLALPTPIGAQLGIDEETTSNSAAPTIPPPPVSSANQTPPATLASGG